MAVAAFPASTLEANAGFIVAAVTALWLDVGAQLLVLSLIWAGEWVAEHLPASVLAVAFQNQLV